MEIDEIINDEAGDKENGEEGPGVSHNTSIRLNLPPSCQVIVNKPGTARPKSAPYLRLKIYEILRKTETKIEEKIKTLYPNFENAISNL